MGADSRWRQDRGPDRSPRGGTRRPGSHPLRVLAVLGAVLIGVAACSNSTSANTTTSTTPSSGTGARGSGPSPVSSASTSSRGVTKSTINVVFPVVALNSLAGQEGFAADAEFGEQTKAINFYVKQINQTRAGSTAGRSTPSSPPSTRPTRPRCGRCARPGPRVRRRRSPCWTASGDWTGDDQLCITQEGHTPFIGAWSTVTNWTNEGSPYLWWTGPDQATILQAVVNWGLSAHLLGGTASRWGSSPATGPRMSWPSTSTCCPTCATPASPRWSRPSTRTPTTPPPPTPRPPWWSSSSAAPGSPRSSRSSPSTSSIRCSRPRPSSSGIPSCSSATTSRASSRRSGLIPIPYEKALDGQEGLTTETLGGVTTLRLHRPQGATTPG